VEAGADDVDPDAGQLEDRVDDQTRPDALS
jgi:hypothetical protein